MRAATLAAAAVMLATPTRGQDRYRVFLRRTRGNTAGRVDVLAHNEEEAGAKAVAQVIEVSYPDTTPAQWEVTGVGRLAA
jgi:hypothetical protein